ncbi:MAG TPA: hypothetical protein VK436_14525 [Methanocella sp.]|nr:hypothetical protein [Methanocella sp.]
MNDLLSLVPAKDHKLLRKSKQPDWTDPMLAALTHSDNLALPGLGTIRIRKAWSEKGE